MRPGPAALAAALLLAAAMPGCAGSVPQACPALAWFNSLTVTLDGNAERVDLVEFCADDVCSVRADGPVRVPVTPVSPGPAPPPATTLPSASEPPATPPAFNPFTASRVDGRTWKVSLLMRSPKSVTIRAYSADGTVLAQRGVEPGWTRVDGSDVCGGPETAGPVRLSIQGT